jgi:hypothetical protein
MRKQTSYLRGKPPQQRLSLSPLRDAKSSGEDPILGRILWKAVQVDAAAFAGAVLGLSLGGMGGALAAMLLEGSWAMLITCVLGAPVVCAGTFAFLTLQDPS